MGMSMYFVNDFPIYLTLWGPLKNFYLPELGTWGHDESKISNLTLVKLSHVIENLNVLGNFLGEHINNCKKLIRIW
jgi:hypothetical protein